VTAGLRGSRRPFGIALALMVSAVLLGCGATGGSVGVYRGYYGPGPWYGYGGYRPVYVPVPIDPDLPGPEGPAPEGPPIAVPLPEPPPSMPEPMPMPDMGMPDFGGYDAMPMDW